jgi:hypothetical protein
VFEAWIIGGKRSHNLLDRLRNAPTCTGLGVMAITWTLRISLIAPRQEACGHHGEG